MRAGTPPTMTSQVVKTEASPVLFDKMSPVGVPDDYEREMKMGIRRESIIRSPQSESRRPSVVMASYGGDFRYATTPEMENSVRRQSQILAEAALRTFKDPASLHSVSEYGREDGFLGRSTDGRPERPYDQRPPGYYPNYNSYQNKQEFGILRDANEFAANRSQQLANRDYLMARSMAGRNGSWRDGRAFAADIRGSAMYKGIRFCLLYCSANLLD